MALAALPLSYVGWLRRLRRVLFLQFSRAFDSKPDTITALLQPFPEFLAISV